MRTAKLVLAAAALATAALGAPASADPTFETGVNTGDTGIIQVAVNSGLGGSRTGGPADGVLGAECTFQQVNSPNNGVTALVIAGHGVAGLRGSERPVSTDMHCMIINYYSGDVVFDQTEGGESAVAINAGVVVTSSSAWTVCTEVRAHYSDGAFLTTDRLRCIYPRV